MTAASTTSGPGPDFEARADELIAHYPVSRRSAILPLMHLWQEAFGFISGSGVEWIAAKIGLEPIKVLELITFYPMFRQAPIGKHHIRICRTLSCALAGSHDLYAELCRQTGISGDPHGPLTSADGKYTIEFVECLASCGTAPVAMSGDRLVERANSPKGIKECLRETD